MVGEIAVRLDEIIRDAAMEKQVEVIEMEIMPDHVHLLLTPAEIQSGKWVSLSQIMQGIKSATSHRINKRRERKGPLWQDESYDRIIRDEEEFNSKLKYICENAAKASLIEDGLNYPFFWWEGSKE